MSPLASLRVFHNSQPARRALPKARSQHPYAVLTVVGRRKMVDCVLERRWTIEATAERFQVDAKTVRKWRDRFLDRRRYRLAWGTPSTVRQVTRGTFAKSSQRSRSRTARSSTSRQSSAVAK